MALNSLRSTLLWMLIPAIVLSSGLSLWISGAELNEQVNAAFDRALAGALKSIEVNVHTESGGLAMEQPFYMLEFMEHAAHGRVYFRVASEDGLSEIGYTELPLPPDQPLKDNEPVFYNAQYFDEPLRLAAVALGSSSRLQNPLGSRIIIQVGESMGGREDFLNHVMWQWLRKDLVILLAFIILIFGGTVLALRPLRETSERIRRRTAGNLQPIEQTALPREVRPLVHAINIHMERYARKAAAQQQFLDDTSHQLRTPLSVLLTQVEYARSMATSAEMKEVLNAIHLRLNNTIQLTNQMMALGRIHDAADKLRLGGTTEPVDLCQVARDVVDDLLSAARRKRQDFGLDIPDHAVTVAGLGWLIQQALSNMVNNAIKYSPEGASITVSVYSNGAQAMLQVEDNGPGMTTEDMALAGHRFRRGAAGKAQHGSGLGLAIVQAIADASNAHMELRPGGSGQGLLIRLIFPLLL